MNIVNCYKRKGKYMIIINLVVGVFMVFFTLHTIYFNIVHLVCKLKCLKKRYDRYFNCCHENDCKWSVYCEKYHHVYTDEEITKLNKMIDEMKKWF